MAKMSTLWYMISSSGQWAISVASFFFLCQPNFWFCHFFLKNEWNGMKKNLKSVNKNESTAFD